MQNKKAISLIVLIITIIVMIILASAIIMSLDNANIFNKAEEAVDKTNTATNKYLSELKLAERELEKIQGASKVTDTNPGGFSGKGTTDDPYLIESIEDLVAFSNKINSGENYDGNTFKLTRLLDFNSDNSYANPKAILDIDENGDTATIKEELTEGIGFIPIGTDEYPFRGTFDGDGAEIRNLYETDNSFTEVGLFGLFGYAEDAHFKNLGVTGSLVSENKETIIGGIVSALEAINTTATIENCYNKTTQKGLSIGGICGYTEGSSTENAVIIQDCYNLGNLNGNDNNPWVGGIVAQANYTNINRCYNKGNITITGEKNIYTASGIATSLYDGSIKNSYNEGTITSTYSATGIIGDLGSESMLENSYNSGKIISYTGGAGICAGISFRNAKINNCFTIGEIQAEALTIYGILKNVVDERRPTINNIYYKEQNNIPAIGEKENQGEYLGEEPIGMTLEAMKSQVFVDTLNSNIQGREDLVKWKLGPNGYPVLDM